MKFQGEIILWRLTADAADPDGSRPVEAEARQEADGSWSIIAASFQTPPLTSDDPPGTVPVVLKKDAKITVAGARVTVDLYAGFSFVDRDGKAWLVKSTLTISLGNAQAVEVRKPVSGGAFKDIRLDVQNYDPATGSFEIAGSGKLKGSLSRDPVALHVKGRFLPPI